MKLTKRLAAAALATSLGLGAAQASTVIYAEDFTGQKGEGLFGEIFAGDSFDASNGQWNISFAEDAASISKEGAAVQTEIGQFDDFPTASATLGGNEHFQWFEPEGPGKFQTTAVNISGFTSLTLSFDYFEIGDWSSSDTSEASYSLDGGATFTSIFSRNGTTGGGSDSDLGTQALNLEAFSLALGDGSSFIFSATVDTSASNEIAGLDNIKLTGTSVVAPVPLPASAFLMFAGLGALGAMRARRKTS